MRAQCAEEPVDRQTARAHPLELVDKTRHSEHLLEKKISKAATIFAWLQGVQKCEAWGDNSTNAISGHWQAWQMISVALNPPVDPRFSRSVAMEGDHWAIWRKNIRVLMVRIRAQGAASSLPAQSMISTNA